MKIRRMTLVYSPDDNGWYWQRYSDWKTSQLFATKAAAIRAFEGGLLVWED